MAQKEYTGKKDFFIVRSLRVANYLCHQGFDIVKVEDSYDNPIHKVFMFERTAELEKTANDYIAFLKQQKKENKETTKETTKEAENNSAEKTDKTENN